MQWSRVDYPQMNRECPAAAAVGWYSCLAPLRLAPAPIIHGRAFLPAFGEKLKAVGHQRGRRARTSFAWVCRARAEGVVNANHHHHHHHHHDYHHHHLVNKLSSLWYPSSSLRQNGKLKGNKGIFGEEPPLLVIRHSQSGLIGRGQVQQSGEGPTKISISNYQHSPDIKCQMVSNYQAKRRIGNKVEKQHFSQMRWVTIWPEELNRFKYCGRSLKIGKGKLGGGDVTYLSCVPARFLPNFLQTSRPDCCGQDRDRALKWQQKILLIAEMALTQNESLDRQYIVLPKDF